MKQSIIFLAAMTMTSMLISACGFTNVSIRDIEDCDTTKFETKTFELANFSGIDCDGSISVTYTQGDKYSVVAKTTPETFANTTYTESDGVLRIHQSGVIKAPTFVYITSPDFHYINASGGVKFSSGYIHTENDFRIDISGAGFIKCDSIACNSLDADIAGAGKIYGLVIARNKVSFDCSGAVNGDINVRAASLDIEGSGAVKMDVGFIGDEAQVECDGACKLNLNVDCKSLKAENNGAGKFYVKGVADQTDIESSGVAKIDTHDLNNF